MSMKLYEAIDELEKHGYMFLNEWKITSDFSELSKAEQAELTKAMNGAYTARKSGNKKNLAKYSAIIREMMKKVTNPKALKAMEKMVGKMDARAAGASAAEAKKAGTKKGATTGTSSGTTVADKIKNLLTRLKDAGLIVYGGSTYRLTDSGVRFVRDHHPSSWAGSWSNVGENIPRDISSITSDMKTATLWVDTNRNPTERSWEYIRIANISDFIIDKTLKFWQDVPESSATTDAEPAKPTGPVRDEKTLNAIRKLIRLYVRSIEQHNWIQYNSSNKSWDWTSKGRLYITRKWGLRGQNSFITNTDSSDKYTFTPDSQILCRNAGTSGRQMFQIDGLSKSQLEMLAQDYNMKTVYMTSGVLRLLSYKRMSLPAAPGKTTATTSTSSYVATGSVASLALAIYNKFLAAELINPYSTSGRATWRMKGRILCQEVCGTDWSNFMNGDDGSGTVTEETIETISFWAPANGNPHCGDWSWFKPTSHSREHFEWLAKIFESKIGSIMGASTTSAPSRPAEPSKPHKLTDADYPSTHKFGEYHFMISITKEDTDDDETYDATTTKILDICTEIENELENRNKKYAMYGLKSFCDWDNDDAHYFYGKYWGAENMDTFPDKSPCTNISDLVRKIESLHSPRIIDCKCEKLRTYDAHKVK